MKVLPPLHLVPQAAFALLGMLFFLPGFSRAQFSETPVLAPPVPVPPEVVWPALDFGLAPAPGKPEVFDAPLLAAPAVIPGEDFGLRPLSAPIARPMLGLSDDGSPVELLGPTVALTVPLPEKPVKATGRRETESTAKTPESELGNVSFKRAAASLDTEKSDVTKPGDLSHRFDTQVVSGNVAAATPLSGWTLIAIAGMVILIVLAISFHRKDSRRRRHRHRHHREDDHPHRHRRRRSSHGEI